MPFEGNCQGIDPMGDFAVNSPGAIQLTHGQRALWYLYRLAPNASAYNIGGAARVHAGLDVASLASAVEALASRHPWLGVRFEERDGEPCAVPDPQAHPRLEVIDLPADTNGEALRAAASERVNAIFDLARGPLVRVVLLRAPEQPPVLTLAAHHIISDFAALGLILHDLERLTTAASIDRVAPTAQSVEHALGLAAAESRRLEGSRSDRSLRYWQRQLGDSPSRLSLPSDVDPSRRVGTRLAGASVRGQLSSADSARVLSFAAAEKATPFTVLASAFQVLLSRWGGQQEVMLGTPATARTRETESTVSYLVNPLVVRADFSTDPSFASHLEAQRRAWFGALRHRDLPHPVLVEKLSPEGADAHAPLFQAMFVHYGARTATEQALLAFALGFGQSLTLGGWQLEPLAVVRTGAQLDVFLAAAEVDGQIVTELTYDTDRVDQATAERLLRAFEVLAPAAVANPDLPMSRLPMLDPASRSAMLTACNEPVRSSLAPASEPHSTPSTEAVPLHARIAAQATRTPDATALVDGTRAWSYRVLIAEARHVADALSARGVGAGDLVGIATPRCAEMVAGMLGVLSVGAAYVPLDPAYPSSRLQVILEDCAATLVLIHGTPPEALAAVTVPQLDLATLGPAAAARADGSTDAGASTGNDLGGAGDLGLDVLAYVIYTSGSTGRPKGVAITHRNADALVRWAASAFDDSVRAGVLASTSICFDLSVFELFATLGLGGTVILAADALAMPSLPAVDRITLINTVPSAAAALLATEGQLPPAVRAVCLAGEPLPGDLVIDLQAAGTGQAPGGASEPVQVYNLYGPSEDTTYSTWAEMQPGETAPPIGRSVTGSRTFLVDGALAPVPRGVVGEIVLGGCKVTRGYLGRPALTAERFVPDPFSTEPGGRLYRTGDLARLRADGELAFLGRLDHQVKVRGFRIELGEIEAALRAQPGVADAAALARPLEPTPGEGVPAPGSDLALVAFVAIADADADGAPTVASLRTAIGTRLPGFMVPQTIIVLDALPRTPNGKVNRRALTAMPIEAQTEGADFVAPETEVEHLLADIWSEVLGAERVGIHDSFFDLGGHSLLAIRVLARVREAFGVSIELRALLDQPTIAGLEQAIADQMLAEVDDETAAALLAEIDGTD